MRWREESEKFLLLQYFKLPLKCLGILEPLHFENTTSCPRMTEHIKIL